MYTVPIRLVPPRFPVDPPPKSHKTINYLPSVGSQTTSPKKKVMLNSDDAIHIVPLLWAVLGPQATNLSHTAPSSCTAAPIHSHRQKNKTKRSFVRHVGPIVACRRLRRQGSMYFPLSPLPVGVKQPAASGRYLYSASNNPAPVPPNPFR